MLSMCARPRRSAPQSTLVQAGSCIILWNSPHYDHHTHCSEGMICDVQAYRYIQRPAAPMQLDTKGTGTRAHGTRVISGQPIGMGGRARLSTFPPFPQACHALPLHAIGIEDHALQGM